MIKANVDEVIRRLGVLNNVSGDLIHYLTKLKKAEDIITPTQDQINNVMSNITDYASAIQTAYNSCVEGFQADEVIEPVGGNNDDV